MSQWVNEVGDLHCIREVNFYAVAGGNVYSQNLHPCPAAVHIKR